MYFVHDVKNGEQKTLTMLFGQDIGFRATSSVQTKSWLIFVISRRDQMTCSWSAFPNQVSELWVKRDQISRSWKFQKFCWYVDSMTLDSFKEYTPNNWFSVCLISYITVYTNGQVYSFFCGSRLHSWLLAIFRHFSCNVCKNDFISGTTWVQEIVLQILKIVSGTTWVQEIVLQILTIDQAERDSRTIDARSPYLEFVIPGLKEIDKLPGRRCLKSHLQFDALPRQLQDGHGKVRDVFRGLFCCWFT